MHQNHKADQHVNNTVVSEIYQLKKKYNNININTFTIIHKQYLEKLLVKLKTRLREMIHK